MKDTCLCMQFILDVLTLQSSHNGIKELGGRESVFRVSKVLVNSLVYLASNHLCLL